MRVKGLFFSKGLFILNKRNSCPKALLKKGFWYSGDLYNIRNNRINPGKRNLRQQVLACASEVLYIVSIQYR